MQSSRLASSPAETEVSTSVVTKIAPRSLA
jgi:hypothetical protein